MPALFIRISRREEEARNVAAAALMEGREERSRGRWVMFAEGHCCLMEVIVDVAVEGVRAAR